MVDVSVRWGGVGSALFDVAIALAFAVTWVAPDHAFAQPVAFLILLMLVEFLLIHGTVFFEQTATSGEGTSTKAKVMAGMALIYLAFGMAFSLAFRSWFPLVAIGLMCAHRMLALLTEPVPNEVAKERSQRRWATHVGLFLAATYLTIFVSVPQFGVDDAYLADLSLPGTGLWIDQPHRVLFAGVFYFGLRALLELRQAYRKVQMT